MGSISITELFAGQIADALNELNRMAKAAIVERSSEYQERLRELEIKEDKLYEDQSIGKLDEAGYRRHLKRVRDERAQYT